MTFKDLSRILTKYGFRSNNDSVIQQQQRDESRAALDDLRAKYELAFQQRKEKWFREHPTETHFNPTHEEHIRDSSFEEWVFNYVEDISKTPEQRYNEA